MRGLQGYDETVRMFARVCVCNPEVTRGHVGGRQRTTGSDERARSYPVGRRTRGITKKDIRGETEPFLLSFALAALAALDDVAVVAGNQTTTFWRGCSSMFASIPERDNCQIRVMGRQLSPEQVHIPHHLWFSTVTT